MKFLITLIVVAITFQNSAASYDERAFIRNNFPDFEEVLSYLNDRVNYQCKNGYYGIAKKRDGYYLKISTFSGQKLPDESYFKVWDAESGQYSNPDITSFYDKQQPRTHSLNDFGRIYVMKDKYDFLLFYGYPEWTTDVIEFLSAYDDLSPADYEILARAHSSQAISYIRPGIWGEYHNPDESLKDNGYQKVSKGQLNAFLKRADKVLNYWNKIKTDDPDYTPYLIENLNLKIGHEYMHFYSTLLSIKEPKLAEIYLKEAWYDPSYVQYAKNYLDACPENGILFTYGDTDTYPLWYVQDKLKYRTDVVILNLSLLQTEWYMEWCKEKYGIKLQLDEDSYKRLYDLTFYPDDNAEGVPFKQWMKDKLINQEGDTNQYYRFIPSNFVINYQDANLEFRMSNNGLSLVELTVLDCITSNPERAVQFTSPSEMYDLGMRKHMVMRGMNFGLSNKEMAYLYDQKSIEIIDHLIDVSTLGYIKGVGYNGQYVVNMLCYNIGAIGPPDKEAKQKLFEKFNTNFPYSEAIKMDNYLILETLSSLYEEMQPELQIALKEELVPIVLEKFGTISTLKNDFFKQLQDLEEIYSIYSGQRIHWPGISPQLSDTDKKVLLAMKQKVDGLSKSASLETKQWTLLKVNAIANALEQLNLE